MEDDELRLYTLPELAEIFCPGVSISRLKVYTRGNGCKGIKLKSYRLGATNVYTRECFEDFVRQINRSLGVDRTPRRLSPPKTPEQLAAAKMSPYDYMKKEIGWTPPNERKEEP